MLELVEALSDPALDDAALARALDVLGHQLEDHVRREEREYYRRIQEVLDDESLDRVGSALDRHLVVHDASAA
jgi:hypothetical protein